MSDLYELDMVYVGSDSHRSPYKSVVFAAETESAALEFAEFLARSWTASQMELSHFHPTLIQEDYRSGDSVNRGAFRNRVAEWSNP